MFKPYRIRTNCGPREVRGEIVGDFGYRKDVIGIFDITHIPTGFRVARAITAQKARKFIRCIERFQEWNELVVDCKDPDSCVIIDVPDRLKRRVVDAAKRHDVAVE